MGVSCPSRRTILSIDNRCNCRSTR